MSDGKFEGFTNYATWNVALWTDNDYSLYLSKCAWMERRTKPIARSAAAPFFREYIGNTPDLKGNKEPGTRKKDIDFSDLAEHWETERQETLRYQNRT